MSINEVIDLSWKITKGNAEYIFMSQVRQLINEIQKILKINQLFNESENKLIDQFIHEKPTRKLHKNEFKQFLTNTIDYNTLEELFSLKFKLTDRDFRKCIDAYSDNGEDQPVPKTRVWQEIRQKDDLINEQTTAIESYQSKYSKILSINTEQNLRIENLQNEVEILNTHVKNLEHQLHNKGETKILTLLNKLKDRDVFIKNLDQVCKEYKTTLQSYERKDNEIKSIMIDLEHTINEQDKIIQKLSEKFALESNPSRAKNMLINLPLIKQCYIFLTYKQENKTIRIFILNLLSIVLMFLIFANIVNAGLRFLFATAHYLTSSTHFRTNANYVYDQSLNSIEFWRKLPFIERLIYRIIDW